MYKRQLSEGEHKQDRLVGASSSPSSAAARVCEQRREPVGRRTWGRLLWLTFLGEARKVSSRRATPGTDMQTAMVHTAGSQLRLRI